MRSHGCVAFRAIGSASAAPGLPTALGNTNAAVLSVQSGPFPVTHSILSRCREWVRHLVNASQGLQSDTVDLGAELYPAVECSDVSQFRSRLRANLIGYIEEGTSFLNWPDLPSAISSDPAVNKVSRELSMITSSCMGHVDAVV